MECNRDEALRAKTIAEKKLEEKDFAGAKKFVVKAQSLYPGLEGLSQISSSLDVYMAADKKVSGEVDWYGILGVTPSADDETVTKQYRKLALLLHPDKNKSACADGAFKFLSEAWSLLSDKAKRLAYNQRRSFKGLHQQKVSTQPGRPSAAPGANGFHNFADRGVPPKPKTQKNTTVPPLYSRRTDTFWTVCNHCKMHYEYLREYLNNTLLCPNCQQAFLATERAPPVIKQSYVSSSQQWHQNLSSPAPGSNQGKTTASAQNLRQPGSIGPTYSNVAGTGSRTGPSIAEKVIQQVNERLKREREELQREAPSKRRVQDVNSNKVRSFQMPVENGGPGMRSISGLYGFSGINNSRPNGTRELTPLETRNMLLEKSRVEIRKKLSQWNSQAEKKAAERKKAEEKKKEKQKNAIKSDGGQLGKSSCTTKIADGTGKCLSSTSASDGELKEEEPVQVVSMNVPDPDFHDFDLDRTEKSFGENQVWAAYDDDDGMPRFYGVIQKVISRNPFKVKVGWLKAKSNSEFGPLAWIDSGFSKTCGEFRVGKYEVNESLNSFSHKVNWTKGSRGIIHIVPKKGDIWALYRNWSKDWNELTPDDVIRKYDMVEVVAEYDEEQGMTVTPLIKVAGFRTVFSSSNVAEHNNEVMRIPREEMFRFSHQVPNYILTGQEGPNAPNGFQELDPASTPLELLQIITQVDDEVEKDGKKVKEEGNSQWTKKKETKEGGESSRILK